MNVEGYEVFDQINEGVQIINANWEYVYVNNALSRQVGIKKENLLGRTMMECYPGIVDTPVFAELKHCMEAHATIHMENEFRYGNHPSRWFDLKMIPFNDAAMVLSFDITKQKRTQDRTVGRYRVFSAGLQDPFLDQEAFLNQKGRIESIGDTDMHPEAGKTGDIWQDSPDGSKGNDIFADLEQKMLEGSHALSLMLRKEREVDQMKTAFVSTASHEFRTPLCTILSSVSLIEKYIESGESEKSVKHFERIKSSIAHLISILEDFLSLDRLKNGNVRLSNEKIDLKAFVDSIIIELSEFRKADQDIEFIYKGEQSVYLDRNVLRNIILNLLTNALKYSGESVKMHVEAGVGQIHIEVTDKGIGIPYDQQPYIFNRFFRAGNTNDIQGIGLGLNIVRQYVEMLGGRIGFTSREGEGTVFTVDIPAALPGHTSPGV